MIIDATKEVSYVPVIPATVQSNNTASAGVDLKGFIGIVAAVVDIGASTAGTLPTLSIQLASSADTNVSNATNISGAVVSNPTNVSNSATTVLGVDTRSANRYLFAIPTIGGTNFPAFPASVTVVGRLRNQPQTAGTGAGFVS